MESIGSDDIPLVDDEPEEADVQPKMSQDMEASSTITSPEEIPATKAAPRMTSSAGSAVKKLWKKATKSKSKSPVPTPESIQPQDSSVTDDITVPTGVNYDDGPSSLSHHHAQRSDEREEDTVQLTLAEETDD